MRVRIPCLPLDRRLIGRVAQLADARCSNHRTWEFESPLGHLWRFGARVSEAQRGPINHVVSVRLLDSRIQTESSIGRRTIMLRPGTQMAKRPDSESGVCGFESHFGYCRG